MSDSILAVGSSLEGLAEHYRVITQNLANVSTVGFKRAVTAVLQTETDQAGEADLQTIGYSAIDFTQGSLVKTDRPFDVAIQGSKGFFVIETTDGPLYTRNGIFSLDSSGQLVDMAGQTVAGESGPITVPSSVPATNVKIARDGRIFAEGAEIGRLKIVEFDDPTKLVQAGSTIFRAPEGIVPRAVDETTVAQGFQEASNVTAVQELVDLISLTRLYEATIKTVQAQDDRMKNILQVAMG